MRKLQGFTLAEVLISIALIGVIASLTLPNLSVNTQKQQVGPSLGKAMSTLESANKMILQDSGARHLETACEADYLLCLSKYANGSLERLKTPVTYKNFNSAATFQTITIARPVFKAKDGITYLQPLPNVTAVASILSPNGKYYGKYYQVLVDINGVNKGPNVAGKDFFGFAVDTSGTVIPYGGVEYASYENPGTVISKDNIKTCIKNLVSSPLSCTGKIFDDGMKVTYY